MAEDQRPSTADIAAFPGNAIDRSAARRATASLNRLRTVLPEPSVSVLAQEVIARLAAKVDDTASPDETEMAAVLADALCARDERTALRKVMRAISDGTDIETIYLTHLTGAARLLGERWTADVLTSAQVTIAAARIYAIMRGISANLAPDAWPDGRHAVFSCTPGERHTLGVSMAADLFRHDGWLIDLKVGRSHDELVEELVETDYAILGLSAAHADCLPELVRLTAAVRVSTPHVRIVIAGRLAEVEPRLQELTDADAVSNDFDTLRAIMEDFHDSVSAQSGAARG